MPKTRWQRVRAACETSSAIGLRLGTSIYAGYKGCRGATSYRINVFSPFNLRPQSICTPVDTRPLMKADAALGATHSLDALGCTAKAGWWGYGIRPGRRKGVHVFGRLARNPPIFSRRKVHLQRALRCVRWNGTIGHSWPDHGHWAAGGN